MEMGGGRARSTKFWSNVRKMRTSKSDFPVRPLSI